MTLVQEIEREFDPKFQALTDRAGEINEKLDHARQGDTDEAKKAQKEFSDQLTKIGEEVATLNAEREAKLRTAEHESLKGQVETLTETIKAIRNDDRFAAGSPTAPAEGPYGPDSEFSFYEDAAKAISTGDKEATDRWEEALGEKTMTEAVGTTGGFLVPDQIINELIELKVRATVLRQLFSKIDVTSDTIRVAGQTQGLVAGWVAELAQKPVSDLAFGEISTNVFTKAGMAVVSNQLLRDATRSVEQLINRDLAKRLAHLEELAFIVGSGVGQPLGILNTPGVGTAGGALTSTDVSVLVDKIITAITNVYTNYFGPPNAIVMHPRTWARIISAHADTSNQVYLVGPPAGVAHRTATDPLPGYNQGQYPVGQLFGTPVYTTSFVPTTLGSTDNQSCVIVGQFQEGLILDRQGVTLDSSSHVYFQTNQTIFRAEDRVGFTAARYPSAFEVIGGSGLAAG